jgi:hypothetical protein
MMQLLSLIDVLHAPARVFYLRFFCLFTGFYSRSLFIYTADIKFAGIPVTVLFSLFTDLNGSYKPCLFFRSEEIPCGGGWDSFRSPHSFDAFSMRSSHLRIAMSFSL